MTMPACTTAPLSVSLLLALAGCTDHIKLTDLASPTMYWAHVIGLCSRTLAVDGDGVRWEEQGCEDEVSFHRSGFIDETTRAELSAAFERLGTPAPMGCEDRPAARHAFGRRERGEAFREWEVCTRTSAGHLTDFSQLSGDHWLIAQRLSSN